MLIASIASIIYRAKRCAVMTVFSGGTTINNDGAHAPATPELYCIA